MAIVSCPECDDNVSDKAAACPHCGYPINGDDSPIKWQRVREENEKDRIAYDKKMNEPFCPKCGAARKDVHRIDGSITDDVRCSKCQHRW